MIIFFIQTELPDFLGRPPSKTGVKEGGSLTADQLRTLISVIFPVAVRTFCRLPLLPLNPDDHHQIPVIWGKIDNASADQRAMEDYQRRKAEYAQMLAVRRATKKSLGSLHANLLDAVAPLPTAPRRPRQSKGKAKQHDVLVDDETEGAADNERVERRFNDRAATLTSFQPDDAESICYLSLAITNLTGHTISNAQVRRGKEYLLQYLEHFAKVWIQMLLPLN